jgi:hypothetical protein
MNNNILRYMAWERAKGELKSMLQTYIGDEGGYNTLKDAISSFVEDVELNGKHE